MKKGRKIAFISVAAFITILLINIGQYTITRCFPINIDWETVNNPANADEVSQDNYICYKKENGILDFPFVMGCKIILQSVETGKKYVVLEDINPLKGVAESAIIGNNILYYKQFMGEQYVGTPKSINIKSKKREWNALPEEMGMIDYGIEGCHFYYYESDNSPKNREVYCCNLKTGEQKKIAEGSQWEILKVFGEYVYLFDQGKSELVSISIEDHQRKSWRIQLENPQEFVDITSLDEKNLAIIISNEKIVQLNIETGEQKTILNFNNLRSEKGDKENGEQWYGAISHDGGLYLYNGYIYENDQYSCVYRLNLKTEKAELIVNGNKNPPYKNKAESSSYVVFCRDYITYLYQYKSSIHIDVYNYKGEFIKEL